MFFTRKPFSRIMFSNNHWKLSLGHNLKMAALVLVIDLGDELRVSAAVVFATGAKRQYLTNTNHSGVFGIKCPFLSW